MMGYDGIICDDQTLTISEHSGNGSTGIEDRLQGLNINEAKNVLESSEWSKVTCYVE